MPEKVKKYRQLWLVLPIFLIIGVIVWGGINYLSDLRTNLSIEVIENVLTVTRQQQQAFDSFIEADRERLHSYADYLSKHEDSGVDSFEDLMTLFDDMKAIYTVVCLDGGWLTTSADYNYQYLDEESLAMYRSFDSLGVRSSFDSVISHTPMFGYYEKFTFPNGHEGVVQLSYATEKFTEAFSLSFYDDQGLNYVVDRNGEILLRSAGTLGDHNYSNIFEVLSGDREGQSDIDCFLKALDNREPGTLTYVGERGTYVFAYVPMEAVDDWFLVSVVPEGAITEKTEKIMMDSRQTLMLLAALLIICALFGAAAWLVNRSLRKRDKEIGYQAALINSFSTYLSRNTENVYMLLDAATNQVEYTSPNVERVLGISPAHVMDAIHDFRPTYITGEPLDVETLRALEPGAEVEDIHTEWTDPRTQEHKWLVQSVYCTQVEDSRKLILYVSDRTKERRNQDQLSEALQMAKAASEAKTAFLGSVSHDIRTPMNAIIGFTTLMKDEVDDPIAREYAGRIETASQHLLSLINDVLDINKIESGSTTLNLVDMNLAEVIDEINAIIRPQAKAKDQTFEITVSPMKYEQVQGDKLRINQILINLLSNSVKYTLAGGKIEMRVEELPQTMKKYSHVRFTVRDNGMGMSEEYLKVIFDPFTREETKDTYGIQGTGLGMAITKSLVDLMGGSIKVESVLGEGSTFTVELQLHIQKQEDDPQFWTAHGVRRILVADDKKADCTAIVRLMSPTGVEVACAAGGESAFDMLCAARESEKPYDLVLLDWKMPQPNGLETARLIRERYPDRIPILLLTAYDWSEIEDEAKDIGIQYFMPKPFFISTFKNAVTRVMGGVRKDKKKEDGDAVKGKHILVVDDIEVNRIILVKILTTLGAACDTASNGQEAVDTFEKSRPGDYDLILIDVQMPVMDGYAATRAIRGSDHPMAKEIPVIAMTANAFVDDVRDALESGMDGHIAKPVQIDNLKSTIQQVLNSRAESKDT